uniref:Peptidase M48 Ste24p n=1 Tax=Saccharolobus islandicus TaxID=43080 RepID=Q0ZNV6_SACIS|nr:hypothetical protein [Sulfolobus islandicus]ABE99610.1 hypothetical protein [Sulfolobus islandicus]
MDKLIVSLTIFVSVLFIGIVKQYIQYIIIRRNSREDENTLYLDSEIPNASALVFANKIIIYGKLGSLSEFAILHESYHLKQKKLALIQLAAVALFSALLPFSLFSLLGIYFSYVLTNWKIEKDADLYAFSRGGKYEARYKRPKSRLARLIAWLLDTHPPDYIRISEEYRRKNIYYLFIKDIIS